MLRKKINSINIDKKDTILFALKKMDIIKRKLLLVFDGDNFYSLLSIGDIQRAVLNNIDLSTEINNILREELTFSYNYEAIAVVRNRMLKYRTECMPILDKNKNLVDVYFWDEILAKKKNVNKANLIYQLLLWLEVKVAD